MNEKFPQIRSRKKEVIINTALVRNFLSIVNQDRSEGKLFGALNAKRFVDSFRILLEEIYGVAPVDNALFAPFWQRIYERAIRFHSPQLANIRGLLQMEDNARLEADIIDFVREYDRLLCEGETAHPNTPIAGLRNFFHRNEMGNL